MQSVLFFVDHVSTWVGKLFAWSVVALTGVVCYEVFMRYVLNTPTTWAYDASYILYGSLFIMSGAYALARAAHVRADVLYRFLKVRTQAWIDLTLYAIFFMPAIGAFMYAGYGFAESSWAMGERSAFSPAGPPLYHFKSLIPIAGFFLMLQGIAEMMRCVIAIRSGAWPKRLHDVEELEDQILEQVHAGEAAK